MIEVRPKRAQHAAQAPQRHAKIVQRFVVRPVLQALLRQPRVIQQRAAKALDRHLRR
jgi:hypothetical protein